MMIYAWDAFEIPATKDAAKVWGLDIEQRGLLVLWVFMIDEFSFLLAFYVPGANRWASSPGFLCRKHQSLERL